MTFSLTTPEYAAIAATTVLPATHFAATIPIACKQLTLRTNGAQNCRHVALVDRLRAVACGKRRIALRKAPREAETSAMVGEQARKQRTLC